MWLSGWCWWCWWLCVQVARDLYQGLASVFSNSVGVTFCKWFPTLVGLPELFTPWNTIVTICHISVWKFKFKSPRRKCGDVYRERSRVHEEILKEHFTQFYIVINKCRYWCVAQHSNLGSVSCWSYHKYDLPTGTGTIDIGLEADVTCKTDFTIGSDVSRLASWIANVCQQRR